MERKHHFKYVRKAADAKEKRVSEYAVLGKEKRAAALYAKRVKYSCSVDNQEDSEDFGKLSDSIASLKASDACAKAMQHLDKAFTHVHCVQEFLRSREALDTLLGIMTGRDTVLQQEALWCVVNLAANASHEQCVSITRAAGPYLITYLSSSDCMLQEGSCWALGNLAGDGPECRALLVAQGAAHPLANILKSYSAPCVRYAAFALTNLARNPGNQRSTLISAGVLHTAGTVLAGDNSVDYEILAELGWLLSFLSASPELEEVLMSGNLLEKALALVKRVILECSDEDISCSLTVTIPLIRFLGNMACGPEHIAVLLCHDAAFLHCIGQRLSSSTGCIIKETLWLLSNMAGSLAGCLCIVSCDHLLPNVVRCLSSSTASAAGVEAARVLSNMVVHDDAMVTSTVAGTAGMVEATMKLLAELATTNVDVASSNAFELIIGLLNVLLTYKHFSEPFCGHGGQQLIESLSYHSNSALRKAASDLLEKHLINEISAME